MAPLFQLYPAELWIEKEIRFIFKKNDPSTFTSNCQMEFILTPSERISSSLQKLEHIGKSGAFKNTPTSRLSAEAEFHPDNINK